MKLPAQVVFKNMERSEWIEEQVLGYANKLDQFCGQIMSCRVTIDMPHKHQVKAKCYHVTVDVTVPGEEIVVNKEDGAHHTHEDIMVAVKHSFDRAKRLLEEYARRRRHNVKTHEPSARVQAAEAANMVEPDLEPEPEPA